MSSSEAGVDGEGVEDGVEIKASGSLDGVSGSLVASLQLLLPDSATFPCAHGVQDANDRAPNAEECVLAGQSVHESSDALPQDEEYFPCPHLMQSEASDCAYLPASQSTQTFNDAPVAPEYFPREQSEQIDAPLCVMYLPGPQDEHVDRASVLPYLPASQLVHAVAVEAPEIRRITFVRIKHAMRSKQQLRGPHLLSPDTCRSRIACTSKLQDGLSTFQLYRWSTHFHPWHQAP